MIKKFLKKTISNFNNIKFFCTTNIENPFTRLIPLNEFEERQKKLVEIINQQNFSFLKYDNLILIPSALKTFQAYTKIPNIHFKQNSNFVYLTGLTRIDSSDCILVILFFGDKIKEKILYHPSLNDQTMIWEGDNIKSNYLSNHVNQVVDTLSNKENLDILLKSYKNKNVYYTDLNLNNDQFLKYGNSLKFISISHLIDKLRLIKSTNELKAMKRTCEIGTYSLNKTIDWSKTRSQSCIINEKQIEAIFDFESRMKGASKVAYPTVAAGNDRATIIHYGANSQNIKYKDWILMDAGCEDFDGYNSDITRSWQIKKNTDQNLQFDLYEALLEVHKTIIHTIKIGITLNDLLNTMNIFLIKLLKEFSILDSKNVTKYLYNEVYQYCPHHVSHYLGLDIHDSKTIGCDEPLKAGMCFTVEPGLYFRHSHNIPKEFKGIGLRIEDNIIINYENEIENLTENCYYLVK